MLIMIICVEEERGEIKFYVVVWVYNVRLVCFVLCDKELDIDVIGVFGWIVLYEVVFFGYLDVVFFFLENGVDFDI